MDQQEQINSLYEENLKLGYQLNYLNDENNFYKIQINNINKLNNNISKDLKKFNHAKASLPLLNGPSQPSRQTKPILSINPQNTMKISGNTTILKTDSSKKSMKDYFPPENMSKQLFGKRVRNDTNSVEPLFVANNKIKLKNLQMKVGNSIRQTQKLKKVLQGSLLTLVKKSEQTQQEISYLARKYQAVVIENQILSNIFLADHYDFIYKGIKNQKKIQDYSSKISCLEQQELELINKLQHLKKQQKNYKKIKTQILSEIGILENQVEELRKNNPQNTQMKLLRSAQVKQLERLEKIEIQLTKQLQIKDTELEEQYRINQEYKQKIADCRQQQTKQAKVMEEEVLKCMEQLKQVKQKFRELKEKGRQNKNLIFIKVNE